MPVDLNEAEAREILFGAPGSRPLKDSKFAFLTHVDGMIDENGHPRDLDAPEPPWTSTPQALDIELPEDARQLIARQHAAIDDSHDHVSAILDGIIAQCNSTKVALDLSREEAKRSATAFFTTAHSAAATARPTEELINKLGLTALAQPEDPKRS
jgi:hypothetical protein